MYTPLCTYFLLLCLVPISIFSALILAILVIAWARNHGWREHRYPMGERAKSSLTRSRSGIYFFDFLYLLTVVCSETEDPESGSFVVAPGNQATHQAPSSSRRFPLRARSPGSDDPYKTEVKLVFVVTNVQHYKNTIKKFTHTLHKQQKTKKPINPPKQTTQASEKTKKEYIQKVKTPLKPLLLQILANELGAQLLNTALIQRHKLLQTHFFLLRIDFFWTKIRGFSPWIFSQSS